MTSALAATARALVAPGKGILAADESPPTMSRRLEARGIESTPEARLAYRELLVTTPELSRVVSGVILHDETLRQTTRDGTAVPTLLDEVHLIPGIKVDTGTVPLAGSDGETVTGGLDGLRDRLREYVALGARFAKWRAVLQLDAVRPSTGAIAANAHALARYAAACQAEGVVPIVEPEVLMDGDAPLARCARATEAVLRCVFRELATQQVDLEAIILKPNMVVPGLAAAQQASAEEVGEATLECLDRAVPAAVPGIAFLSGGQDPVTATRNLAAIATEAGPKPRWELTFSFGRALQDDALAAWKGEPANVEAAQDALAHRAWCAAAARAGVYRPEMEQA